MSQNHYQDEFEDNKNTTYVSRQMNYLPEVNISAQNLNHGLKFVHDLDNVLKVAHNDCLRLILVAHFKSKFMKCYHVIRQQLFFKDTFVKQRLEDLWK